jgi:prepilin-type N-terminal cleavage/methylation domain-containing protein
MRRKRRGFSLIELVIVMAIILIISVLVAGPMNQQLMMAHETAAVGQIKTIQAAEAQYFSQFQRYPASLGALGPPATGTIGPEAAGLIPAKLALGKKSGFVFATAPTADGYALTAVPEKFGSTGRRSFYSDETLVIRNSWTAEAAGAGSTEIE